MELSYGSGLQREKSVLKNGNTPVCTTYFISKDSELEIKPSSTRYIDYIYAEGRIVALHVHNTTANADSLYYVQTDLLGSWDRIVNGNRQVVQRSHFDPWGNRMSATNWTQAQDGSTFAFRRGFTGHEHSSPCWRWPWRPRGVSTGTTTIKNSTSMRRALIISAIVVAVLWVAEWP